METMTLDNLTSYSPGDWFYIEDGRPDNAYFFKVRGTAKTYEEQPDLIWGRKFNATTGAFIADMPVVPSSVMSNGILRPATEKEIAMVTEKHKNSGLA